jgi:hypothetical protein
MHQSNQGTSNNSVIHKILSVLIPLHESIESQEGRGERKGKQHGNETRQKEGEEETEERWETKQTEKRSRKVCQARSGRGKGKGVSGDTIADFILKDRFDIPRDRCLPGRSRRCRCPRSFTVFKQRRFQAIPADTLFLNDGSFLTLPTSCSPRHDWGSCCQKL